jgi:hypothetical protein
MTPPETTPYFSVDSPVYHVYSDCTVGDNIDREKLRHVLSRRAKESVAKREVLITQSSFAEGKACFHRLSTSGWTIWFGSPNDLEKPPDR